MFAISQDMGRVSTVYFGLLPTQPHKWDICKIIKQNVTINVGKYCMIRTNYMEEKKGKRLEKKLGNISTEGKSL